MTTRIWTRLGNLSYRHLRKTLESNQIPEGTSRLAGGPYRHQGLSSVVLIIGLEPITSDVSGRRSHQLSYMSGCGQGRTRTFNHSINSRGLYLWATSPNGGRGGTRTPKAFATDLQSAEPTNCSTLPLLYTLQGSNLWPVVCNTTATTIWAKSVCFSSSEQI